MSPLAYYLVHVVCAFLLVGVTFQAFAAPKPENRKRSMMLGGILSLLLLVAGFGLLAKLQLGMPGWIVLKLVAWIGLSALGGLAFRRPDKAGGLAVVAAVLIAVAVYAVYAKPF